MCELCERSPSDYEPPTQAALALARFLTFDDHWNALHCVVEDGNVDDENIERCRADATSDRERQVIDMFAALSEEQRLTAIALHEGILT
jgi:hypothetical protein